MIIRRVRKIRLNHWQKLMRNLSLILIFIFLSFLAINFNKFTKASALKSLMNSYMVKDYKVICELSPDLLDIPGNDVRYLVEVKDSYLVARVFHDGIFWSEGYINEFPKENMTLIPLENGITTREDHTNFVLITSHEDAVSAKLSIHCIVYDVDKEDNEYKAFDETYVSNATITKEGFFYFGIDSKYEINTTARRYEEECLWKLESNGDNMWKQPLKNITIDVELYDSNQKRIERI